MVSDNKNINRLSTEAADEPTTELEILSLEMVPTDEELEMDASTFSLDEDDSEGDGRETLESNLRTKDERISNLQYDIEQLRARWVGLEKEISAREELTDILQGDLKAAHKNLAAKDKQLSRNEREATALNAKLDAAIAARAKAEAAAAELGERLEELTRQSDSDAARIAELEQALDAAANAPPQVDQDAQKRIDEGRQAIAELTTYIDGRKADWERLQCDVETLNARLAEKSGELASQDGRLTAAASRAADAERARDRLDEALREARNEKTALKKERNRLKREIDDYRSEELAGNQELIARQAGMLAAGRQRIDELEAQCIRSERYADELRDKLATARDAATNSSDRHGNLQHELAIATEEVRGLEGQLQFEQDRAERLQQAKDQLEQELDEECRRLRFELGDAQDTIVEHATINEELTSNLLDHKAIKEALEEQLSKIGDEQAAVREKLEIRIRKLEQQVEDYERKIANKDNAISALLSELSNNSRSIESIDEIESVIHEIDDRMSERIDDRVVADRERPTRLLIGNIDGQELRFPLFKDRLTIGRTVQNDIQLRAQYISRRHAVLLADEDGTKIVDWGSKNGVYVNNARISEQVLKNGDKVAIGTAEFIYEERSRR